MYNLPTELKLEILSHLPFNESKDLYSEFKCEIPTKIIKHWYKYYVLLQLPNSILNYSRNYNVLRLMLGMTGLAYSS